MYDIPNVHAVTREMRQLNWSNWPRGYKTFFHAQLNHAFNLFLLINVKTQTIAGILTFISGKNSILGFSIFYTYEHLKDHAQLSRA